MNIKMLPNLITTIRIVGSVCLLFLKPLSKAFFIVYTLSGLSDAIDGFVARKTNSVSELGTKLDSIADLMFYIVMIAKILPMLIEKLPFWIWYMVLAVVIMRMCSYTIAAIRFHRFSSLHTYLNKTATLMIFFVPYVISKSFIGTFCFIICVLGILSSAEEIVIHLTRKEYRSGMRPISITKNKH